MACIVRTHYRGRRPLWKRAKAVALTTSRIVLPVKDLAAEKSSDAPDAERDLVMLRDRPQRGVGAQPLRGSAQHG